MSSARVPLTVFEEAVADAAEWKRRARNAESDLTEARRLLALWRDSFLGIETRYADEKRIDEAWTVTDKFLARTGGGE